MLQVSYSFFNQLGPSTLIFSEVQFTVLTHDSRYLVSSRPCREVISRHGFAHIVFVRCASC